MWSFWNDFNSPSLSNNGVFVPLSGVTTPDGTMHLACGSPEGDTLSLR